MNNESIYSGKIIFLIVISCFLQILTLGFLMVLYQENKISQKKVDSLNKEVDSLKKDIQIVRGEALENYKSINLNINNAVKKIIECLNKDNSLIEIISKQQEQYIELLNNNRHTPLNSIEDLAGIFEELYRDLKDVKELINFCKKDFEDLCNNNCNESINYPIKALDDIIKALENSQDRMRAYFEGFLDNNSIDKVSIEMSFKKLKIIEIEKYDKKIENELVPKIQILKENIKIKEVLPSKSSDKVYITSPLRKRAVTFS